jgi:peptidoglycan/xylan/chitin deacetylase (PgdA/CDA1 family)
MRPETTWLDLDQELKLWADAGLRAVFWLRDDDAVAVTPALLRLETLARQFEIDVGLAVIPAQLGLELTSQLTSGTSPFQVMCHGWVHANHGKVGAPAEFGPERSLARMSADLEQARAVLVRTFGQVAPYFVPPFGQITAPLSAALPQLGFGGLSNQNSRLLARFARLAADTPRLPRNPMPREAWPARLDAHVDPIDWRRGTARDETAILSPLVGELRLRRKGYKATGAPIGLLGHHLVHDEAIWSVLARLIEHLRRHAGAVFPSIAALMDTYRFAVSAQLERGLAA